MTEYTVVFQPEGISVRVPAGNSLLQAQIDAGLRPDAPCGGKGTCGKCAVTMAGREILACQTAVDRDMTVFRHTQAPAQILTGGIQSATVPDGLDEYVLAFDIGTTTVAAYLLSGVTGAELAHCSSLNPQGQYGADVISRIQHVLEHGGDGMARCIRRELERLAQEAAALAGITTAQITTVSIVGNTAMHHLLLGLDPQPLVTPPYMPEHRAALVLDRPCRVRVLPNIAGFVGADTVGCLTATRFDQLEELTLLIDIGTNGEMVLGDRHRRIACSTAAGPAFEGAKISCGMRGAAGAVDHVTVENGALRCHVLGDVPPLGLCGSGLLDLVAALLDVGVLDESGYLPGKEYRLCDNVVLTQKDVREVQLAKAAIRAGIELLAQTLGVRVADIRRVLLAGAFGSYLSPAAACRIGMIPPVLEERVTAIGNAAGAGARLCALSQAEFDYSQRLAAGTEFLELAGLPQFQDRFVDALDFSEEEA